jgi:hypothetical protein
VSLPSEPSIAGTTVIDGRITLSAIVGLPLFEAALRTVDPADAESYETTTPMGWVTVRTVEAVIVAVAHAFGRDPVTLNAQSSRVAVERTVRTVWRPFLRLTTDAAIVTRAPMLYRRTFSHGALEARMAGANLAELAVVDWPRITDIQIAGLGAGVNAVLSVAGRRNVVVASSRTPGGVAYKVTWR